MLTFLHGLRQFLAGRKRASQAPWRQLPAREQSRRADPPALDIAPNDPIIAYFLSSPVTTEIDKLNLDSPALRALKAAGVKLVVPLVSQGELVGLLNLGPRRSEKDYSADDRGILNALATQAAPAVRVAQLVREQQSQVRARERLDQELQVARLIQQTLLPKELPEPAGWKLAAYWKPARAVGGDFYDFFDLPGNRLGIVIGDVTDKGIPAALVMATTRSILRAAAQEEASPGKVLERTNDLLYPDIPDKMFVTCLYAILEPASGLLRYANAGHDLPYRRYRGSVNQLRAIGMPLGLMPSMDYEDRQATLQPGESVLFYSDGLVEAHTQQREMFGFPRLLSLLTQPYEGTALIDFLLEQLTLFTGTTLEPEDDVTMVLLQRLETATQTVIIDDKPEALPDKPNWYILDEWEVPSEPGNERLVMERVGQVVSPLKVSRRKIEQLKTAVAEATMNAMEHGNNYQLDVPVSIRVAASPHMLSVSIRDLGGDGPGEVPEPDLEAKLAAEQPPRGWGLFLIKNLVDEMQSSSDGTHHTVELLIQLEGAPDGP